MIWIFLCLTAFAAGDPTDDIAKEMEGYQKQAEQVLQQVDKLGQGAAPTPMPPAQMDEMKRKALKLANDDRFLDSVKQLWQNENRNKMLAIQAAFFLFMFVFKAWRQSRPTHWFKKMILNFIFGILTIVGISYVIPLIVLGEPFGVFTGTLWRVLVMGG